MRWAVRDRSFVVQLARESIASSTSPTAFCPSLDIVKDGDGELHIRRNKETLDAFLAECFQPT